MHRGPNILEPVPRYAGVLLQDQKLVNSEEAWQWASRDLLHDLKSTFMV